MKLKGLIDYDLCNFKLPSMFLIFPECSFKCDYECGKSICQNSALAREPIIEIEVINLIHRYLSNPLTHSIICGGLEPFDTWDDLYTLCSVFRGFSKDPIVIYTGYNENEIVDYINSLSKLNNIIVKFGRFIPNSPHIFDTILGVELASNNQYAKYINGSDYYRHQSKNNGEDKNE